MKVIDKKRRVAGASAIVLAVLQQSVAAYAAAPTDYAEKYIPEMRAEQTAVSVVDVARQIRAQAAAAIVILDADTRAGLDRQIRRSTRELLMAAAPIDETAG